MKQQQQFSNFNMNQGQSHQQYNSPQMNIPQRNLQTNTSNQLTPQLSQQQQTQQQLKGLSPDPISKDQSDMGSFNVDDTGFMNFQNLNSGNKNVSGMLISPQQILQQQSGNNDFYLQFPSL